MSDLARVTVAGAGAFGTALALVADRAGRKVTLWGHSRERTKAVAASRESTHLPGVAILGSVAITSDVDAFRSADIVLLAVPAQATRSALASFRAALRPGVPVVACAKGIEKDTGYLQSEIIADTLPQCWPAALSGPGFAEEIARGLPTAVTIAADDMALAEQLCERLSSDSFRPYASDDLVAVELGGAIKNVLAIACGVVEGRGLGESARAALIARGLAEMVRLGTAHGARRETFMGLSGLGDLVLTATSKQSRNLSFGAALGRGLWVSDLLAADAPLVEGAYTAGIAAKLARSRGVDVPIIAAVAAIIDGTLGVEEAIAGLVSRPLKRETG